MPGATARRYRGVWWVRAELQDTLLDDLAALGARFIPGLPDKPEDAALITVDQLAQMRTEKPWLLIYDNADGPSLLRRFTPADNAHVLITTRRTGWQGEADEELAVDVFDRDTAIAYLIGLSLDKLTLRQAQGEDVAPSSDLILRRREAPSRRMSPSKHELSNHAPQARKNDADAAGRLADALHCLPLALSHARAYCWARNWGYDQYIAKLPELIAEAPKDAPYPASVFATFSLAIEKAAKDCAQAETLMALLAFFAPDKIPLWLIPEDVLSEKQRDDALAALTSVSLAAHDSLPDGAPAVSVHRLVQEVMRGRLRKSGGLEDTAGRAITILALSYSEHSGTILTLQRRASWLPHALSALDHAAIACKSERHTWGLCAYVGDFHVIRGDLSSALDAYGFGKKIAEVVARSQPDNADWQRDLSVSYNKVGDVLAAQGNLPEALKAYRDSLAIRERLAKADPGNAGWQRDLSVAYIKVGDVLAAQGAVPEALKAYRDSLAIRERLAKADPGNAQWQVDVAFSYWRLARHGDEPKENWRKVVDSLQRLHDEGRLAPVHKKWLDRAKERLAALEE